MAHVSNTHDNTHTHTHIYAYKYIYMHMSSPVAQTVKTLSAIHIHRNIYMKYMFIYPSVYIYIHI